MNQMTKSFQLLPNPLNRDHYPMLQCSHLNRKCRYYKQHKKSRLT